VTKGEVALADSKYRDRWRCLLSVDDLIGAVHDTVSDLGLLGETYFILTSDHGFHFHELRLGIGKWNVYETDIRVPFIMEGPGIQPNSTLSTVVGSHADLAPTWLELAGIPTPDYMDGRSVASQLVPSFNPRIDPGQQDKESQLFAVRPLTVAYIEYHGLGPVGAPRRLLDSFNNTFRAIRVVGGLPQLLPTKSKSHSEAKLEAGSPHQPATSPTISRNLLYAQWGSDFKFSSIVFRELFDLDSDPWQMHNIYDQAPEELTAVLANLTRTLYRCKGPLCR
jgi:arylsulfatase A-like enzyme